MKAYEINWEYDHLVDMTEDVSIVTFEGLEDFRFKVGGIERVSFNREIYLRGNFNIIPSNSDYPVNDIGAPIMSKRMISIINQMGSVEIGKTAVTIIDDTYLGDPFDEKGNLFQSIKTNYDYSIVQVLAYTAAFDYDKSIFKPLRSNPSKIGIINKLVLKRPLNGFPSIFRIEEKPGKLFLSQAAKEALEANNIKGCVFEEVEVS